MPRLSASWLLPLVACFTSVGCAESHTRVDTFGPVDGADAGSIPGALCIDGPSNLLIMGPEPGCVNADLWSSTEAIGPFGRPDGTPLRVLALGEREASLQMRARCEGGDGRPFTIWTYRSDFECAAESLIGACRSEASRWVRVFDILSRERAGEFRISGRDIAFEVRACIE